MLSLEGSAKAEPSKDSAFVQNSAKHFTAEQVV